MDLRMKQHLLKMERVQTLENASYLRIHCRLSTILKTSKKVYEVMFFYM